MESPFTIIAKKSAHLFREWLAVVPSPLISSVLAMTNERRQTLLHAAVKSGSVSILRGLLARKCFDVNEVDVEDETALDLAVARDYGVMTRLLLQNGAVPIRSQNVTQNTSLHIAAALGKTKSLAVLLEERCCSLDEKNRLGYTALHVAIANGRYNCYMILKKAGASLTIDTKSGMSTMHLMAISSNLDIIDDVLNEEATFDLCVDGKAKDSHFWIRQLAAKRRALPCYDIHHRLLQTHHRASSF